MLEPAKRLLAQSEELASKARERKQAKAEQLARADQELLAGQLDSDAYDEMLLRCDLYLGPDASGMGGHMRASQRAGANAVATAFGLMHAIYDELQRQAAAVVAEVERIEPLPAAVWNATSTGQASTLAIRGGRTDAWSALVRLADRWSAVHNAAALARETKQFDQQVQFPHGCPRRYGTHYLGGEAAEEQVPRIGRLPEALWVPAMIRAGLRPGLYLAADHLADRERQAAKARPNLLERLRGSGSKVEPIEVM
jgi:hypothetical protein